MEYIEKHGKEFLQPRALDNVAERGARRSGNASWIFIAEKAPDTEDYALLHRVRWSIKALKLKCTPLNITKEWQQRNKRYFAMNPSGETT